LSYEAIDFAIAELKRRGFDTNDIELHNKVWRLTNLISEDGYETVFRNNLIHISFKSYIFIIIGIVLVSLGLDKYTDITISLEATLFLIGAMTIIVLLENVNYKIRKQNQIKRTKEIKKLKVELDNTSSLNRKKQIFEELKRQKERTDKDISFLVVIFLLLIIFAGLAKIFAIMKMK